MVVVCPFLPSLQWFHSSYHGFKVLGLAVLMFVSFFIPNDFFLGYAVVAQIASVMFVLLQLFIIIDFAFDLQDFLVGKIQAFEQQCSDEGRQPPGICQDSWKIIYLAIMAVLFLGSIICIASIWGTLPTCGLTSFFLSETLVLGIIFFVLSIAVTYPATSSATNPGAIPPSLLFANNVWLAWGALTNNPDTECNPFLSREGSTGVVVVSLLVVALSITWTTVRAAHATTAEVNSMGGSHTFKQAEIEAEHEREDAADSDAGIAERAAAGASTSGAIAPISTTGVGSRLKGGDDDDAAAATPAGPAELYGTGGAVGGPSLRPTPSAADLASANRNSAYFHMVMFLGSCYLAMLLSNWGTAKSQSTATSVAPEASDASMWVRIATQFASWLMYLWILAAPIVCPARFARHDV